MREIKFRAWDGVIGKFHYSKEYPSMWQFFRALEDLGIRHFESQRYTGLKDKNGIEIYEGDMVEFSYGRSLQMLPVTWGTDGWWLKGFGWYKGLYWATLRGCEVIGNIYENPMEEK